MKLLFFTIAFSFLSISSVFADIKTYKVDLNNDGKQEIITVHRIFETIPITKESLPINTDNEITVLKPDRSKVGSFSMPDHMGKVEFVSFNNDGFKQIVTYSEGGSNYTNIAIYGYKDGKLYEIFENGSACGIEADFKAVKPMIKVGRANWKKKGWREGDEPLWQVYVWNGNEFIYDKKLSSTSEIGEDEEGQRFLNKAHELMEKKNDNKSKP